MKQSNRRCRSWRKCVSTGVRERRLGKRNDRRLQYGPVKSRSSVSHHKKKLANPAVQPNIVEATLTIEVIPQLEGIYATICHRLGVAVDGSATR